MVWLESHGIQHWEKVQHLGRNNPIHQCRLGADWLGRSSAKRDLGVLVDKWDMNQQCAGLGRCCQQVKGSVSSPLLSAGRHIQSTGFHFRLPCTGKNGHAGVSQPTNHRKRCQTLLGSAVDRATSRHNGHKVELEKLSLDTREKSFIARLIKQRSGLQ